MRIGTKMLVYVMVTSVSIFLILGTFVGIRINRIAVNNAVKIAQGEADKTANLIKADLELDLGFSRALASALNIYPQFDTVTLDSIFFNVVKKQVAENPRYMTVWYTVEYFAFRKGYTKNYGRRSTTAFMKNGIPTIQIEHKNVHGDVVTSEYYKSKSCNCELILDPYIFQLEGKDVLSTTISVPMRVNGQFAGLGGVDLSLDKFQETINEFQPYRNSTIALISNNGTIIAHTNREFVKQKFIEVFPEEDLEFHISEKIRRGTGTTYFTKQGDEEYLNIVSPIKVGDSYLTWAIDLSIPMSEILVEARRAVLSTLLVFFIGVVVLGVVIWLIARSISEPIRQTTVLLNNLAQGDIDKSKKVFIHSGDEIETMARSVSKLIDGLNSTEEFAREIGKGNLDAKHSLLGEKDLLGISLLEMQKSLKHAQEVEQKRKEEEEKQNWATQGMAMFGEILRQNNDNLAELSYNILKNLVKYTGSIQGGLFVLNDNDKENLVLEMTACYAYDRRKFMEKTVLPNEGLVGRVYIEGKTIFMTDIPRDYINITSGLGQENPRCLIVVPLKQNDEVLGAIEMASFTVYEKHQIEFIEKIASSIASTISSVRINIRTAELLAKSQQQAEEMSAQEEEMRQNMEELQATQEEMERKRIEQEEVQAQLREDKSILDSLLHNSPDYIYQKDISGKYVRISDSMLQYLNVSSVEEAYGRSDFDLLSSEQASGNYRDEQDVLHSRRPIINKLVTQKMADGMDHKVALTILPLIEDDGEIIGILGIKKILTDVK
jgi:methyl-accepting chemotaxis protein